MFRRPPRRIDLAGLSLVLACLSSACSPELIVGKRLVDECAAADSSGSASASSDVRVIEVPWSTDFEDGFCDYERSGGTCYDDPDASHRIVDQPVHAGNSAAAFTVTSDPALDGRQTRCYLEGTLPVEAVYGAWFYLSSLTVNNANWNLFHFRGGPAPPNLNGLWDVSLDTADDGSLFLYVRGSLTGAHIPEAPLEVPIGSWFHVEFRLRRAADATGEVELRQDGASLLELTGIVTDGTAVGQWYVGNLADGLMPPDSTVYVDDVTISSP